MSGAVSFDPINASVPKYGNTSDALTLNNLLTKRAFLSQSLSIGDPGDVRLKEDLNSAGSQNSNANIFYPSRFNHDLTLAHHINARTSFVDPEPVPTVTVVPPLPEDSFTAEILEGSCDTAGFIRVTAEAVVDEGLFLDVVLTFGYPYWAVGVSQDSTPEVTLTPQDAIAARILVGETPYYVSSDRTQFTVRITTPALELGVDDSFVFAYFVMGNRIETI